MRKTLTLLLLVLLSACTGAEIRPPTQGPTGKHPTQLVLTERAHAALTFLYANVIWVEWAACLNGYQKGETIVVNEVVVTKQTGNTRVSIDWVDCRGYPGVVHSHPMLNSGNRDCLPSRTDVNTFWRHPRLFDLVWCGKDSFVYIIKNARGNNVEVGGHNMDGIPQDWERPYMGYWDTEIE